ncbi:MAG: GNAT family N-acetyltransferase [Candidatus Shapirobacteria bacterium]|jgi:GNAT superfamily N-acetyltransferase
MTNSITIRRTKEEDAKAISLAFKNAYLPLFEAQKLSRETIRQIYCQNNPKEIAIRIRENYFFIAEDTKKSKLVGVIGLRKDEGSQIYNRISTFFVIKEYQSTGVGSMLYKKLYSLVIKLNVNKLVVSSSLLAEPIYSHWGFKRIKIITKNYPNGDKYKNVWMEKVINPGGGRA